MSSELSSRAQHPAPVCLLGRAVPDTVGRGPSGPISGRPAARAAVSICSELAVRFAIPGSVQALSSGSAGLRQTRAVSSAEGP